MTINALLIALELSKSQMENVDLFREDANFVLRSSCQYVELMVLHTEIYVKWIVIKLNLIALEFANRKRENIKIVISVLKFLLLFVELMVFNMTMNVNVFARVLAKNIVTEVVLRKNHALDVLEYWHQFAVRKE